MLRRSGKRSDGGVLEAVVAQNKNRKQLKKPSWADATEEEMNFLELELNQVDEVDYVNSIGKQGSPKKNKDMDLRAWNDVKDIELDVKKVQKARKLEMEYVKCRKVSKMSSELKLFDLATR